MQGFKFNQAGGRQELIRGCAQGGNVKNFYAGWCSFVKTAKQYNGAVSKAAVAGVNDVDIYLNTNNIVVKMEDGNAYDVSGIAGVACVPKDSEAFKAGRLRITIQQTIFCRPATSVMPCQAAARQNMF